MNMKITFEMDEETGTIKRTMKGNMSIAGSHIMLEELSCTQIKILKRLQEEYK